MKEMTSTASSWQKEFVDGRPEIWEETRVRVRVLQCYSVTVLRILG